MNVGVSEAARHWGISGQRVRQLLADGQIKGRRIGQQWVIDETELKRKPLVSRALSLRMAWGLIDYADGVRANVPGLAPNERHRVRELYARLLHAENASDLLRAWLPRRAERQEFGVAIADLEDLKSDPRLKPSGVSDQRSGMSAGSDAEGYVYQVDLSSLVSDFLLVESARPNVFLHVAPPGWPVPDPIPAILVAADLAEHQGPREDSQVERIVAGLR